MNNSESKDPQKLIVGYAEQSSALAHSISVKLERTAETTITSKESLNLASDLSHIWASCKVVDNQIQEFCSSENGQDETILIEMLTNLEHVYSHALSSMRILSKMMKINGIITETES